MMSDHWELIAPPKSVGSWKMPGAPVYFHATVRPRWLTRLMMKLVFQWEWRDQV